ncbi:hypothetical protein TNCV_3254151 [Trichonephila clavipes]|nr:hypothetical protein TNCV_3254151 [Trichonephila clavipes]
MDKECVRICNLSIRQTWCRKPQYDRERPAEFFNDRNHHGLNWNLVRVGTEQWFVESIKILKGGTVIRFLFANGVKFAEIIRRMQAQTATAGSDVVQSGRPIFDDFFQHLWPYIGNNTANVVFQMVMRLWLIRIDQ